MRILILNWRDPKHPFAGGAEKSIFEHAKFWAKQGARVTWFASTFANAKKEQSIDGIKIIRAGNHYTVHLHFIVYSLLNRFKDVDIVVDCFHFVPFFTPIFASNKKKIALIQETGGRLWFNNIFFPLSLIGYLTEPLFFLFYRGVEFITSSDSTKKDLVRFGIKEQKVHIIPHGVDRKHSNAIKEKNPTILYLGFLTKDKGFEDASEAASIVKQKIKNLQYWIAGKEGKKGDFNWHIGRARNFAKYFGFVSEKEKFDLYKKAWVLVHPSEKEGWGLTVVEAATQGTPTVGYDVPGLRDSVKNNKTGVLVVKNPQYLANAIISLVKNKQELSKMSQDAISWSKKFNWEKSTKESWSMINSLMN